ncbi:MAG: ATP-binding protein, partial [Spirochaetota bacterium]|nr:ATP-binding protein [Spirochaetota bacterium]
MEEKKSNEDIEKSIRKKFHKTIWSRFVKAIKEYQLIQEGDRIAVCISGGKDSMLMAKLFQELQRHRGIPFEVKFLVMDPGYKTENRQLIESNAAQMNIPLDIFETNIFNAVVNIEKSPCYLCARMRRGHLYKNAQDLGCNKIAYAHHKDDVVVTMLMSLIYEGRFHTFSPVTYLDRMDLTVIRPLMYVNEADVIGFVNKNEVPVVKSPCPADGNTRREYVTQLLAQLNRENPGVKERMFT